MELHFLILTIMATTSNVIAEFNYRFGCDGVSYRYTKYCYIPDIGPNDLGYYQVVLVGDYSPRESGYGCRQGNYKLVKYNNRAALSVSPNCNGFFEIKAKTGGYQFKGQCGQDNFGGFKIINGRQASSCQFPWMAFVRLDWKPGYTTNCGGSIIKERWILTAAHCIVKQGGDGRTPPSSAMTVRTGSLEKFSGYVERTVDWVLPHPQFSPRTMKNDIGLLRLSRPIRYDGCHGPVCLNTDTYVDRTTHLTCRISGWGMSSWDPSIYPKNLLWAFDRILPRSQCDSIYGEISTDYTLCGRATSNRNRGFCQGDSGGPLVCKSPQDGRYYQHGVVSLYFGHRPCSMEGLYTSVAAYFNWYRQYIYR